MYAFFRSRTLGYDVYPEDFFLRNFPWQQYGGLWIVNEARFARAEPINALTAQALRRVTGVGASPQSTESGSPTSYLTNSSFEHQPATSAEPQSNTLSLCQAIPSFDGSVGALLSGLIHIDTNRILNMSESNTTLSQPGATRPGLTLLTDVGRRYPGFPTPLSPTLSAKELYPTPTSVSGSRAVTPRLQSPAVRSVSPMSIDGSNMCGPSTRCISHDYKHFAEQMGTIDGILAQGIDKGQVQSPYDVLSTLASSLTSPVISRRALSPRAGMLRNMATQQTLHRMHDPAVSPVSSQRYLLKTINLRQDIVVGHNNPTSRFSLQSVRSLSPRPIHNQAAPQVLPSIQIANGTEFETGSPISPAGTMLSYASNRAVDSGLLAVPALSEPQVAEYRFWVSCGRRVCAFGCGGAHEGESAAAKRLFNEEGSVAEYQTLDGSHKYSRDDSFEELRSNISKQETWCSCGDVSLTKPVEEWRSILRNKERDGSVARI